MQDYDPNSLTAKVTRIETKLDMFLDQHEDHNKRIRDVEKKVWVMSGVGAALGAVGGKLLTTLFGDNK